MCLFFFSEDERDRAEQIMGDLYLWVTGHCKRANLMIISRHISDDLPTFVERITLLRSLGYHVIIAQPEKPSEALLSYVSFVWPWENLAAGRPPYDQTGSSQDDSKQHFCFCFSSFFYFCWFSVESPRSGRLLGRT